MSPLPSQETRAKHSIFKGFLGNGNLNNDLKLYRNFTSNTDCH